jgi:hypothetical protein
MTLPRRAIAAYEPLERLYMPNVLPANPVRPREIRKGEVSVVTYNGHAVFVSPDHAKAVKYAKERAEMEFPEASKWAIEERGRTTIFAHTPFLVHSGTQFKD